MTEKIRVGLIYKKNYIFFNEKHFDKISHYFFLHALKRNQDIEIKYFPAENNFDCSDLKGKVDVILLPNNNTDGTPNELNGIKKLDVPVICRTGDPHWAKRFDQENFHDLWGIDCYFNFMHRDYFHEFYPKQFEYKTIFFGVEPKIYEKIDIDFENRIKNQILNSGALGKSNLKSRMANKILNPKQSGWYFYKLRTIVNNLDYVIHSKEVEKKNGEDNYQDILSKYSAAIAATTYYPTTKYWEISAAGCLTFMEITKLNRGNYLGYKDGENAIFINEKNYKNKFQEYLNDVDNPKWKEIAFNGKNFTMKNFNNDQGVKSLVSLISEFI